MQSSLCGILAFLMKRTVRYRDTSKVPEFRADVISAARNDDLINRRRQIRSRSLNRVNAPH